MNFDEVLVDIEKLVGRRLNSIRHGAEITVEDIDGPQQRVIVLTASGQRKSRPYGELRRVWESLCIKPAIHVDSLLGGSGSSRNQPETIFANLPYIEWLNINSKKHLCYVGGPSHPIGTLKQMDAIAARNIKQKLVEADSSNNIATVVVVSDDIGNLSRTFEGFTGLSLHPSGFGIYEQEHSGAKFLVVPSSSLSNALSPGTYLVIGSRNVPEASTPIRLAERTFYLIQSNGLNLLVESVS